MGPNTSRNNAMQELLVIDPQEMEVRTLNFPSYIRTMAIDHYKTMEHMTDAITVS